MRPLVKFISYCCVLIFLMAFTRVPYPIAEQNIDPEARIFEPVKDTLPQEPDIDKMRKHLWHFFKQHISDSTVKLVDARYSSYWGPDVFSPYSISSGHLFSNKQRHCIVYYSDERGSGAFVYIWKAGAWKRIFADTLFPQRYPEFKDWNKDGMLDMSVDEHSQTDWWWTFDVWLMDKSGEKLYEVKDFSEIPNPKTEASTHHLVSINAHGWAVTYAEYIWKNYALKKLRAVSVSSTTINNMDSSALITYDRISGKEREIYCNRNNAWKMVPKKMQKVVRDYPW